VSTAPAQSPFPAHLLREDLRDFTGYSSARTSHAGPPARIWLNANESASASTVDPYGAQRRYPEPQPPALVAALAAAYDVPAERVVVGRGSDEAIDLLIRALCRPGGDGVVIASPTFGMYAVGARLHGVPVTDVPQRDLGTGWAVDTAEVAERARSAGARLVFLAGPGNPTGGVVPLADLARLAGDLADQAVVVLDEAYQEFNRAPSAVGLLGSHPNLVVLRTLSKAHALAAARVGCAIAHPELAAVLRRVQAPYPLPGPVTALALAALAPDALHDTRCRVEDALRGRIRLVEVLRTDPRVRAVYDSEANFVLTRCTDPDGLLGALLASSIVVRDLRHLPGLDDALRITVGTDAEIDSVAQALTPARIAPVRTR